MTRRTLGFVVPLIVLMAATAHGAPYLGVALGDAADERAKGAIIVDIAPDSPAAKHGLAKGDIIFAVNKVETPTAQKLIETVQSLKEGNKVELKVWRDGKEQSISVTLGKRPPSPGEETPPKGRLILGLGFHQPGESGRLIVARVFPGTPAEAAGIEPGDAILELDGTKIKGYEQLTTQLRTKKSGDKIVLKVEREGKTMEKNLVLKAVQQVASTTGPMTLPYETYSGYFVSNKFESDAAESFVVLTGQEEFDKVFGAAFVMGDKSRRLAKDAFKSLMVVAAIKRGKAVWEYKVERVTEANGVVELRYTATEKKSDSATFASPLIVSIPRGKYVAVRFVVNGKTVKTVEIGEK